MSNIRVNSITDRLGTGSPDLPTDRTHRDSWFVEDSELTDGVGADYGIGSDNLFSMEILNNGN